MHCLDLKPVMAKRHRVKQTHSTLFWDTTEGKYLLHQKIKKKIQALLSPNHSCTHATKGRHFLKQDQIKPAKPQKDQTGEFCPVWRDRQREIQNIG